MSIDQALSMKVNAQPSLRDLVADRIRDSVISGRFQPGQRLVERELCELTGVSRTSIREALRELVSEGLITSLPNKGPIVSVVSVETAESIYQVRAMLEGLAARLFATRASDIQVRALEQAADELELVYRSYSAGAFLTAKARFYNVLLEGCGNEIAAAILRTMHARISLLRATSLSNSTRAAASIAEIRALLNAIKARDENAAWLACVVHIENAAEAALKVLRRNSGQGSAAAVLVRTDVHVAGPANRASESAKVTATEQTSASARKSRSKLG